MNEYDIAKLKALCDMANVGWISKDFYQAARTAVPQLIDMVEHLTSGVREMTLASGEANARAERAEAEVERLDNNITSMSFAHTIAEERAERAEAALRRYGKHKELCNTRRASAPANSPCDCGLDVALTKLGDHT